MPDRNVQGVCRIANASFPKGCTNAQINSLKSSSTQSVLDYFKNTLELSCWYKYLARDGITEGLVLTIKTSFDNYQMACPPDKELNTYIYRSDGLKSDFKSIYPIEYHPAYDYWLQNCKMAEGCREVFEEYNKRQYLIWDKNQNAAEPVATQLLQLALKISATPITTTTTTTTTTKVTTTPKKQVPPRCKNGETIKFTKLIKTCIDGSWALRMLPTTTITSPKPTSSNKQLQKSSRCDAANNAILNIVDYYRFGNSHSQSQLENNVRTISSFLRELGFSWEAKAVDNASSLGDVLSLSQNIVGQNC